jgi:RNA polymerase sigma factor (sigma-70 family)
LAYLSSRLSGLAIADLPFVQEPVAAKRPTREEMADGQLVTLALNGDRRAFPVLMRRYEGALRGMVLRRVRSPEDAADIVQDTLLSAWAALQTYTPQRPFQVWLIHIALNKCRDWGRRRTVRQKMAIYLDDFAPEAEADAEAVMIHGEDLMAFQSALGRLPDVLRQPLMLTGLAGLSQRDAARKLGVTIKGVETRVRRARLALRDALEPQGAALTH